MAVGEGDDDLQLAITVFGVVAVTVMVIAYALEKRSKWFVLVFAGGCAATSAYSGLAAAYPITVVEGLWTFLALRRFYQRHSRQKEKEQQQEQFPDDKHNEDDDGETDGEVLGSNDEESVVR